MPVVNLKSNLYRNPQLLERIVDPKLLKGRPSYATGSVAAAMTDSVLSTYLLAELPSDGLMSHETAFHVLNWAYATVNIGTKTNPTALGTVARITAPIFQPIAFGDARHGLELWLALGLAVDPGGLIGIYAHAPAAPTVAGPLKFQIITIQN